MFRRTCSFFAGLGVSATSAAPQATAHPSIKEAAFGRPTVADSFMDGGAVAGCAADVAETPSPAQKQRVQ